MQARKAGWSQAQAASLARNLTVNFNRRGAIDARINAFYPFFNAAIQGSQIILKAGRSKRVRRLMLGLVATGFLEDQINAALSDEDEDGELAWDKIPDWKHRRNFMFITGSEAWSVPLPYGYNLFLYAGKQASRVVRGVKPMPNALGDVMSTAFESFSPISGSDFLHTVMPTVSHPMIEMATNSDWQGRPIRPEDPYGDYGPQAYKYFAGASNPARVASDVLNRATGGSRIESGRVDVSPEYFDHLFGFVTGGTGRFTGRVIDGATKLAFGNTGEIERDDIPFIRQLSYATDEWLDRDRYYAFREEVRDAMDQVKTAQALGVRVSPEVGRIAALDGAMRRAEKSLAATATNGIRRGRPRTSHPATSAPRSRGPV